MRHSVLFTRLFSVVVLMILMTALFTTGIYTYIARNLFTQIKEDELVRKAQSVAKIVSSYDGTMQDLKSMFAMFTLDEASSSLLGANMVVVDEHGAQVFASGSIDGKQQPILAMAAAEVLVQGPMRTAQIPALKHTNMVGIGVPISVNGAARGAVLLLVPMYEALIAMGSMNGALMLSLMLSLPLTAAMVFYVIGRVVNPLRQMTGVATQMAGGNFSERADTSQRGEVGELAQALNYLSQELSHNIATLTFERNRLQQTVNGLSEGIIAVDRLIRITHTNPAVERLLMPRNLDAELEDDRLRIVPHQEVWQDFKVCVERGEPVTRSLTVRGSIIFMTISPIHDEQNQIAGAVALFSDITESERLERTRRDYVANVSHEMRTPLTAMRALLEPLSEGMVQHDETRKRYYAIMLRETMRLSRLINDLLELSRLQSGATLLMCERTNLQPIFEEMLGKYEPIAEEHQQEFIMDAALADCPAVMTNADRVEQILVILIDNAIKYTPDGGKVKLSAEWDRDKVWMSVSDNGVGIDERDQPYVFDRFYKVDKAHSGLGSGLGLSIAREVLNLMGETIELKSVSGEGTTFRFSLTRAEE